MSTRSVIARPTLDGFEGRYHHWDGYPSGLGKTLFDLAQPGFNSPFDGDVDTILQVLLDDHPAGWSTINGVDWGYEPGFGESALNRPQCYCHGDREEEPELVTESNASAIGCEYAYLLEGRTMTICSSYNQDDGSKMVGAFGMGDPHGWWEPLVKVDLDGPEPDWTKVDGLPRVGRDEDP